jgi:hypothetical protein
LLSVFDSYLVKLIKIICYEFQLRSKINGAVLARSSQPNVGLLAWRLNEDEQLIKAISDCCSVSNQNFSSIKISNTTNCNGDISSNSNTAGENYSNQTLYSNGVLPNGNPLINAQTNIINDLANKTGNNSSSSSNTATTTTNTTTISAPSNLNQETTQTPILLIIDARFRTVALANRVKGGGYEYSEYYTNCEIQFMNLENIHVIRNSFQALRLLCQTVNDNKT